MPSMERSPYLRGLSGATAAPIRVQKPKREQPGSWVTFMLLFLLNHILQAFEGDCRLSFSSLKKVVSKAEMEEIKHRNKNDTSCTYFFLFQTDEKIKRCNPNLRKR